MRASAASQPDPPAADVPGMPAPQSVHVGRQPVYDRAGDVTGYELLFRVGASAADASERGAYATSQVLITAFSEIGIATIAGDRRCFVNLTREFLVGDLPLPFDPGQVVLEVLETVTVDEQVVAGVERLAAQGFAIALDDFVPGQGQDRLLPLATYVKIDALAVDPAGLARAVRTCRRHPHLRLVAERLETDDHLRVARDLGFDYFQGYVLGRPEVISMVALAPSRQRRLDLLGLQVDAEVPVCSAVSLVTGDPALSLRVLALTNADPLGLPVTVSSIHEAVLLLGVDRVRDWTALMLVSDQRDGDEPALSAALSRARMCQKVGERLRLPGEAAFTVGLLSAAGELMRRSPAEVAERLPLRAEVSEALTTGAGPLGDLLSLVRAYEASDLPTLINPPPHGG
jgi:EAL and modified HD-GYP domain-containing signal transduction protein